MIVGARLLIPFTRSPIGLVWTPAPAVLTADASIFPAICTPLPMMPEALKPLNSVPRPSPDVNEEIDDCADPSLSIDEQCCEKANGENLAEKAGHPWLQFRMLKYEGYTGPRYVYSCERPK